MPEWQVGSAGIYADRCDFQNCTIFHFSRARAVLGRGNWCWAGAYAAAQGCIAYRQTVSFDYLLSENLEDCQFLGILFEL